MVVVPFPFSDLSQSKRRPALVLAGLAGEDVILCQITSRAFGDSYSILLDAADFESGSLNSPSLIRPNRLFTASSELIAYSVGSIRSEKHAQVVASLAQILK